MKTTLIVPKNHRLLYTPIGCLFILAFMLSGCISQRLSAIDELQKNNKFSQLPEGVSVAWNLPLNEEEIEQIIQVSSDKVLVRTLRFNHVATGILYNFKYANLMLINIKTGRVEWTLPVEEEKQYRQDLIETNPYILLKTTSVSNSDFIAIDPESGKIIWKQEVNGRLPYAFSHDRMNMLLADQNKNEITLKNITLNDGKQVWETSFQKTGLINSMRYDNDICIIMGNSVISLNPLTGKKQWQYLSDSNIDAHFGNSDNMWIYNSHSVTELNRNTGKAALKLSVPDKKIQIVTCMDSYIITAENDSLTTTADIVCYSRNDSHKCWTFQLNSVLCSPLYQDGQKLYFTTQNSIQIIDLKQGKALAAVNLPDEGPAARLSLDVIIPDDNAYNVIREYHMIRINKPDYTISGVESYPMNGGYTPSFMLNKFNSQVEIMVGTGSPQLIQINNGITDAFTSLARQNQAAVYRSANIVLSSGSNASSLQRSIAIQSMSISDQMMHMQESFALAEQVGTAIGAALAQLMLAYLLEYEERLSYYIQGKINCCTMSKNNSITGNVYLRPYFDQGWRLGFTDIRKMEYASLPMTPGLSAFKYSVTQTVPYCFVSGESGSYIMVKSCNRQPTEKDTYSMICFSNITGKAVEWKVPRPTLVCYNVNQLVTGTKVPWKPYNGNSHSQKDEEFLSKYLYLHKKELTNLVKTGADVNVRDEMGRTPLMNAFMRNRFKLCYQLVKLGADPRLEDMEGYRALDYQYIPLIKSGTSTNYLIKAVKATKKAIKRYPVT